MNCLFVGAGAIAGEYAAGLLSSSLSLAGVCDLDEERAMAVAERHDCPWFTDLETALTTVDAPLVVNLTSHAAHAAITRTALTADRHVYSQKPLALDAEKAGELLAIARDDQLGLDCAPGTPQAPAQRRAGRLIAEGRLGPVQLGYAHAHVGRVTDWHDRPRSFLDTGPLYDGGVYPLALLISWFGPVSQVRTADALDVWPDREAQQPTVPSHVEAMLEFSAGPVVRLTASLYAPHRSREFYGLEIHGDDGSLYVRDTGTMADSADAVSFGRVGREYTSVPSQTPTSEREYLTGVEQFAAQIASETAPRAGGRRGCHVVAICNAIETAAAHDGPVEVDGYGVNAELPAAPTAVVSEPTTAGADTASKTAINTDSDTEADMDARSGGETDTVKSTNTPPGGSCPPIGLGCSRFRNGEYVDRVESIATGLDAGYRLLDGAELYGNEHRIGELLSAPGSPDRETLYLIGKVWRTNHQREHLLNACAGSLEELGVDSFDCYMLHWPDAWAHRGQLTQLADQPVARQEELTFPEREDGEIETADISLATAWENLEDVLDRGWARSLGVCNISQSQLETIQDTGDVDPAVVQVEHHPYQPRDELLAACQAADIQLIAHSPLSAPGLLEEPVLREIGRDRGLSPAEVVMAWNVNRGVIPIPSSTTQSHIVGNLGAAAVRLTPEESARIDALEDPGFQR